MAGFTKVNPVGGITLGTLYSTLQLKVFETVFATPVTGGLDTYNTTVLGDLVAQEFGTTGALFQFKSDGAKMVFIGDGHALDADIVKRRVENVVGTTVTSVTEKTTLAGLLA